MSMKMSQIQVQEKKAKTYRPYLSIEPIVKLVPRKFEIKETSAQLIESYAKYLSQVQGSTVSADAVVEHLALTVSKDKGFTEWLKSHENRSTAHRGAGSAN